MPVPEQDTGPVGEDTLTLSDVRQFVTFVVEGEAFAVDIAPVQEIIRVPQVVRVPLAPKALEGLANLRGRVLPILSLRRIFGFEDKPYDDLTRAIVIDIGQPLGFVVDNVSSIVAVEPDKIQSVDDVGNSVDGELLSAMLRDVEQHPMVMVLDFQTIISREFKDISKMANAGAEHLSNFDQFGVEEDLTDELQLVSFSVAGQEYAIDIAQVQEIVQIPETVVHVPHAPDHVIGMMTLRNRLLPLVSVRSLFNLPSQEMDDRSRVVVVSLGSASVGLVTDSVSEVLRVPATVVDPLPSFFSRNGTLSEVTQICRLDGGKRLVSILTTETLFRDARVREAIQSTAHIEHQAGEEHADDSVMEEEEQFVVFRLMDGEFGVPIESVQEIVRVPERLTHVPKAPPIVEGVINLRGAVLPVIDQRKRLGLPRMERNDRQRIMVLLLAGVRTGFVVDAVLEVLKLPKSVIEETPHLSAEQALLLGRVANLEKQKRLIQLIDPSHLLDETEKASLTSIVK